MKRTAAIATLVLAGCASGPPAPDWQMSAKAALDQAVAAHLQGNARVAQQSFERATAELARTGSATLMARAQLTRCAAMVASLQFEPCTGFDALRADAEPAELAYADFLAGKVPKDSGLLPAVHKAVLSAADPAAAVKAIDDPVSRLVAAGVAFEAGRASPGVITVAIDTASAQGWRRPLLAWLNVLAQRAEQAGDAEAAARVRRRIAIVLNGGPAL